MHTGYNVKVVASCDSTDGKDMSHLQQRDLHNEWQKRTITAKLHVAVSNTRQTWTAGESRTISRKTVQGHAPEHSLPNNSIHAALDLELGHALHFACMYT